MVYDFNIIWNYVIFMDLLLIWDFVVVEKYGMFICWFDDYGVCFGVMLRNGKNEDVVWYDIDLCYVYYLLNVYEDGDIIFIDVCWMVYFMKEGMLDVLLVFY